MEFAKLVFPRRPNCYAKYWRFLLLGLIFACFNQPRPLLAELEHLPFSLPKDFSNLPQSAVIETTKGSFEIEFYRNEAPVTIKNFEYLAQRNFYKNLTFHRYVPGFIVQGGDPLGNGRGNSSYTLPPENSQIPHVRGTVGMARNRDEINPERRSNGSQFYITLTRAPHLDGFYTVFAHVVRGMEHVDKLRPGDKILRVYFPKANKK